MLRVQCYVYVCTCAWICVCVSLRVTPVWDVCANACTCEYRYTQILTLVFVTRCCLVKRNDRWIFLWSFLRGIIVSRFRATVSSCLVSADIADVLLAQLSRIYFWRCSTAENSRRRRRILYLLAIVEVTCKRRGRCARRPRTFYSHRSGNRCTARM